MTGASDLGKRIQIAATDLGARLFRHNVAKGVMGDVQWIRSAGAYRLDSGDAIVRHARILHAGLVQGGADYLGWTADGRFLAAEVKYGRDRLTTEQRAFLDAVQRAGGIVVEARSVEDLLAALNGGR